jgi:hypothetical protein
MRRLERRTNGWRLRTEEVRTEGNPPFAMKPQRMGHPRSGVPCRRTGGKKRHSTVFPGCTDK